MNADARRRRSTSSQVSGVDTVGCGRARSEYGATVVLAGLFWLQSTKHLARAQRLRHPRDDQFGLLLLQLLGERVRVARTSSRRRRPRPARRAACPSSRTSSRTASARRRSSSSRSSSGDLAALDDRRRRARVEVEDEQVGARLARPRAEPATAARAARARPGWPARPASASVLDDDVVDGVAVHRRAGHRQGHRAHPRRRAARRVLLEEERLRRRRSGSACRVSGRSARCGSSTGAIRRVVVDHLALGEAGLRVQHLVEVRTDRDSRRPSHVDIGSLASSLGAMSPRPPSLPSLIAASPTAGQACPSRTRRKTGCRSRPSSVQSVNSHLDDHLGSTQ